MSVKGDNGVVVEYTLKSEDGERANLTGTTVKLVIQKKSTRIEKDCVIIGLS